MAGGADWDQIVANQAERADSMIVVNMGPAHPSTHGVMRLVLEMDGETVLSVRPGIGFLHSGIEKQMEHRTWTQGAPVISRCNYVAHTFNEAAYCLAVDKALGITADIPERANVLRVMAMELNRIASHLIAVGSCALELGASSVMMVCLRERERCLDFSDAVCGLRMNTAYIRPGGVSVDLPTDGVDRLRELVARLTEGLPEIGEFTLENPIFKARMEGVGTLDLAQCMALGVTGPALRATGYSWDLRKMQPYCGYETYDFDVCGDTTADGMARWKIRLMEMDESVRILKQCVTKLQDTAGQPHVIQDPILGSPSDLSVGADGQGNSNEHVRTIMGTSMEELIHHVKKVTSGFPVPPGQVYQAVEAPGGELGCFVVSDGGNKPFRVHLRDPGFHHVQAIPMMCEGGMLSDMVVSVGSIDPVMGGVDR
ncbi:MAG: NADH-quinone oxidoreductase subunit D [Propionibacteriaceae bacterium]|nr:NADH-quinone oxidoreductase subunit D [Propionibacteriaceae bacterium]